MQVVEGDPKTESTTENEARRPYDHSETSLSVFSFHLSREQQETTVNMNLEWFLLA